MRFTNERRKHRAGTIQALAIAQIIYFAHRVLVDGGPPDLFVKSAAALVVAERSHCGCSEITNMDLHDPNNQFTAVAIAMAVFIAPYLVWAWFDNRRRKRERERDSK